MSSVTQSTDAQVAVMLYYQAQYFCTCIRYYSLCVHSMQIYEVLRIDSHHSFNLVCIYDFGSFTI